MGLESHSAPAWPPEDLRAAPVRAGWRGWRDRLLGSPAFQRFAAGFLPTRAVARRRAQSLFDLCAGFVYSQVLHACVTLRVFDELRDGPRPLAALAPRLGLAPAACLRLLEAAASLQLVERRGADWGLGPHGAVLVGNAGLRAMIEHHALLYADLADPVALLRGTAGPTRLAGFWGYARAESPGELTGAAVERYSALMSASQSLIAEDVLDAYPLHRHACLLDVAGGDGTFLCAALGRHVRLRGLLFDLPAVAALAGRRLASGGFDGRAQAVGGDFGRDPLPTGADVASLVRVVHDHEDETVGALLRAVRRALPRGGTLLLAEPLAGTPGATPVGAAYFGFYLLAMGSGRARTAAELAALLQAAGFDRIRQRRTRRPMQVALVEARAA